MNHGIDSAKGNAPCRPVWE